MQISVISASTYYGSDKIGPEKGAAKLRSMNLIDMMNKYVKTEDLGDIPCREVPREDIFKENPKMKYFGPLLELNQKLAEKTAEIREKGNFPFVIGGDHVIAAGSISGISHDLDTFAVLWMDAHGDLNYPQVSDTYNVHGMPCGLLVGEGNTEFTDIYKKGPKIKTENLFMLGQRDLDKGEVELIDRRNIYVRSWEEMKKEGVDNVIDHVITSLKELGIKHLHISFDIDFIDKEIVPGTGTRVANGANVEETKYVLKRFLDTGLVKSFDIVELNVDLDIDDKTAKIAYEIVEHVVSNLK